MRILFTCGGTAGHINPALGVAGLLRERLPDTEILFVGARGMMEEDLVPREGYEIRTVGITNLQRGLNPKALAHNLKTVRNVARATAEAKRIIREFKPDAAVGTGGYVCYPVLRAARGLGVPTAVHESNAVPGLTTKMLEGVVDRILVGFEDAKKNYRNQEKVVVTGTPVRKEFLHYEKAQARAELGIPADKPLIVSVWGSLGAERMNEIMVDFIQRGCRKPFFRLIHSAGARGHQKMVESMRVMGKDDWEARGLEVRDYIYDMPRVMAAADLVMCRAGASTLAELAAMGKPAVLVPSPNVTNNHQEKNARVLEAAGAARVLLEGGFGADGLLGTVSSLLQDPDTLAQMSRQMRRMGVPDATERIAEIILELK